MVIRFLKIMAAALALGFALQGCAIYIPDRDDFRYHHGNWEHHDRGDYHDHGGHER